MIWHILPLNDIKEHIEESICICNPEVEIIHNGDIMIVHNAFDNRD